MVSRFYYGWHIAFTLAVTEMISWGILFYAFSVVLKPLQAETGWDQGTITGAFSVALLVSGFSAIPIGRWLDRYGARVIMTLGSCAAVLLALAWSQVTTIPGFYAVWVLIGFTTATVLYEPAFTVVANWFIRKRSLALTVLTFGGGLASVVFVPLTDWLVREHGWRSALMVLAIILGVVTIPLHALVLRRRPSDLGLLPDGDTLLPTQTQMPAHHLNSTSVRTAIRQTTFWWLSAAFSLSTFAAIAISVHLISYLTDQGFSSTFAAGAVSLVGGSQIPGRLVFTPLSSRISRHVLTMILFGMQAAALLILIASPTQAGVIAFAVLFGSGAGASTPARAAMLAEIYGTAHYGSISGVQSLVMTLTRSIAPVGMGALVVLTHSYQPFLWAMVLASVGAIGAMLMVSRGHRVND